MRIQHRVRTEPHFKAFEALLQEAFLINIVSWMKKHVGSHHYLTLSAIRAYQLMSSSRMKSREKGATLPA